MESTQYFEHALFYDCGPTSVEHYTTSTEYIFEPEPSKLRLSVFVQPQRLEAQPKKDEDVSLLLRRKSRVVAQRDKLEMPPRQFSHNNELSIAGSSSVSGKDPKETLSTVLDLHQGYPVSGFLQQQKPVSALPGYADLTLNEIGSFVECTKHDFRVFYLRQTSSFSRLLVTKTIYEALISCCHVFPRFNEYLIAFCRRNSDPEIGPAPLKYRLLYTGHSKGGPGFGESDQSDSCSKCTYALCVSRVRIHPTIRREYQSWASKESLVATTIRCLSSLQTRRRRLLDNDSCWGTGANGDTCQSICE